MLTNLILNPANKIVLFTALLFGIHSITNANGHHTQVINADVINIEPIYMNYTLQKVSSPCKTRQVRNCWNISYQKKASKTLQGYRISLSYKDNKFTTRTLHKPTQAKLKIRVKSDLLAYPSNVAINAAVAY